MAREAPSVAYVHNVKDTCNQEKYPTYLYLIRERENCVLKIKAQLNCRRCLLSVHNIFGLVSKYLFHVVKSLGYQHFESACLILSFGFLGLAANKKLQIFERNFRDIKFKVLNKLFTV